MQFSSLGSSKMELSEPDFFDILTIPNDQISYIKHVLALYVFFTLFGWVGGGGGSQGGRGTTCLCSFPASAAQEWSSLPSSRCLAEGNRIWAPAHSSQEGGGDPTRWWFPRKKAWYYTTSEARGVLVVRVPPQRGGDPPPLWTQNGCIGQCALSAPGILF